MVTIQVKRNLTLQVDRNILQKAAQVTLDAFHHSPHADITIVIGNDALLQRLNQQYRHVDSSTDVLSFPSGDVDPDTSTLYLGDVIISLPHAIEQATAAGHSLAEELQLLVVHGTLHLLGYDHMQIADKQKMQSAEDKVMKQLGLQLLNVL